MAVAKKNTSITHTLLLPDKDAESLYNELGITQSLSATD